MPGRRALVLTFALAWLACEPGAKTPPSVVAHPADVAANVGQVALFQVEAKGSGELRYQWERDGAPVSGATRAWHVTPPLTLADHGARYRCRVTGEAGRATSHEAALAVTDEVSMTVERVKAKDGWLLGVRRFKPRHPRPAAEPLVFSHGFLENHHVYDLAAGRSLAMTLARRGFEVWVMDLRGTGLSAGPKVTDLFAWRWSIDDFIHLDAPAVVDHVLAATGKRQVFWVGHSMGGLIGYAYLETESPAKIKGLVTLAGAGWMGGKDQYDSRPGGLFMALGTVLGPFLLPDMPFPVGEVWKRGAKGPLETAILKFLSTDFGKFTWSLENMDEAAIDLLMDRAVDNTGMNMVRQFVAWTLHEDIYTYGPSRHDPLHLATSSWYRSHGFVSYKDGLSKITAPALVLAGESDQVVPAGNVTKVYEALSSKDKTLRIFGRSHGDRVHVGHEDILAGVHSPAIVYPEVVRWLERRASR